MSKLFYIVSSVLAIMMIGCMIALLVSGVKLNKIEQHVLGTGPVSFEKPLRIYNILLDGAGTVQRTLSVSLNVNDTDASHVKDPQWKQQAEQLREDVLTGRVTHILIQGHPYKIQYENQNKYFMHFKMENECGKFPFPECPSMEPVESSITQVMHVLGYRISE